MAGMPRRILGRTEESVSLIGLGGAHIARCGSRSEAVRLVREAIDRGINFLDNSWDYSEGRCERWMGEALKDGYRERVFLMTKIDARTGEAAAQQLEESLKRLKTDVIDLLQLHEVIRQEDSGQAFAPGGVMDFLNEARWQGKIRFIGFTGHKDPRIHLEMLGRGFEWDAVQMPLNVLDAHFMSFEKMVLPELVRRGIGVLAMKPLAAGELLETGSVEAVEALQYVMNLPVDVVITGMESGRDLEQALAAAESFAAMGEDEVAALLERTRPFAGKGRFERYKTTNVYDGTVRHPEWLTSAEG